MTRERLLARASQLLFFVMVTAVVFLLLLSFSEKIYVRWEGRGYWHTADDHMITQRVAWNIRQAGVPYYNPAEPVAAQTSLVWPYLLSSVYFVLDHRTAVPALMVLSALAYSVTVSAAAYHVADRWWRAVVLVFLAAVPSALLFAATAWEHIPQMVLFTAGSLVMLREREMDADPVPTAAVALFGLAFLIRPDTAVAAAIPALVWLYRSVRARLYRRLPWLVLFLALPVAYLAAMYVLYQSFWPNTANLKLNFGSDAVVMGLRYVLNPYAAGVTPYLTIGLIAGLARLRSAERVLAAALAAYLLYVVVAGGDVFAGGRFFLFLLPTAVLLSVLVLRRSVPGAARQLTVLVAMLLLVLHAPVIVAAAVRETVPYAGVTVASETIREQMKLAQMINERLQPADGSIGLHALGVGYHLPRFHVVDFLGKAEPYIARLAPIAGLPVGHNKFDYPYVFATYRIAAFPLEEYACARAASGADDIGLAGGDDFYVLACAEALKAGKYTFLTPEELGLNGTTGLVLRTDLLERFLASAAAPVR